MFDLIKSSFKYFIVGILSVIPVVIILQILLFLEEGLRTFLINIYGYSNNIWITVLAFALSFMVFAYIGYRISTAQKLWALHHFESVIDRIPIISTIYRVTKKLVELLSSHEESKAKEIVFIEYPKDGLWVPGYVTNKVGEMLVIYVPTSPNPTSGFTLVVHQSKVVKSHMDLEEVSSFVVSVGVDLPKTEEIEKLAHFSR